jgi:hypothetical protein
MNYRAASRAVSRIATPKNYAASPAFYICYKRKMRGRLRGIHIPRKRDKFFVAFVLFVDKKRRILKGVRL